MLNQRRLPSKDPKVRLAMVGSMARIGGVAVTSYLDEAIDIDISYFFKVVAKEEPGFAGVVVVLALTSMLVLGLWVRRRR